jgi:hypothetical protein
MCCVLTKNLKRNSLIPSVLSTGFQGYQEDPGLSAMEEKLMISGSSLFAWRVAQVTHLSSLLPGSIEPDLTINFPSYFKHFERVIYQLINYP